MNSIHDKLEKVRKPRIHIKYEVETEEGTIHKELPFVVGVMGDFSGNNQTHAKKPLKERKFVHIDQDNFNQVMTRISPGVQFRVENTLTQDDSEMSVVLHFNSLQDFEPINIVNQIDSLRQLKEARNCLRDLLTKSDRSDELEIILEEALQDRKTLLELAEHLGLKREE